jgi:hypothetical protein
MCNAEIVKKEDVMELVVILLMALLVLDAGATSRKKKGR